MEKCVIEFLDSRIPVRTETELNLRPEGEFFMMIDPVFRDVRFLNKTSKMIFDMCDGNRKIGEIVKEMKTRYPQVEESKLRIDVYNVIRYLEALGILRTVMECKVDTANTGE